MKILVSDPLAKEGLDILRAEEGIEVVEKTGLSEDELAEAIKGFDAIIIRSGTKVTRKVIEAADRLRVIGRAGVGLDNVDVAAASERGIVVMNTPGGNTVSAAEHTCALILALSRNIPQAHASVKAGEWDRKRFKGVEVRGKTLGIVGLGRIGMDVAARMRGFGMEILGYDPFVPEEKAERAGVKKVELEELFARSDYITFHVPITDQTRGMVNDETIKKMKRGVRIVNAARGGIVDEAALARGIESGHVAGAALDVYEKEPPVGSPVLALEKVVLTPHLGASTEEAQITVAVEMAGQIIDALKREVYRNAVNAPMIEPERREQLAPYMALGERLGAFLAQLFEGPIRSVSVEYIGEQLAEGTEPVTVAVTKGVLEPVLVENVNYVNAPYLARSRGMTVSAAQSAEESDFVNLLRVRASSDDETHVAEGTLFGRKEPMIVGIDGFHVDAEPHGALLLCWQEDGPGIIGKIGTVLGRASVNIAGMTLGRSAKGGDALGVLNLDTPAPPDALEEISRIDEIRRVRQVIL